MCVCVCVNEGVRSYVRVWPVCVAFVWSGLCVWCVQCTECMISINEESFEVFPMNV